MSSDVTTFTDNLNRTGGPNGPGLVIVLARYPEPGKVKTRLIPALGPEGAARLQDEMTRFTLARLGPLRERGTMVEVRYTGADEETMRVRYGAEWLYRPQGAGDLGERLSRAAGEGFDDGHAAVALIGTDCPDLGPAVVGAAFEALAGYDVALGPAEDGGYYLIALRSRAPALFEQIPWGASGVLAATVRSAQRLGLGVALLPRLRDVDLPEDLPVWEQARASGPT